MVPLLVLFVSNKALFSNENYEYRSLGPKKSCLKVSTFAFVKNAKTQIRKLFPCCKTTKIATPPPCCPLNIADVVEKTFQHRGVLRILRGRNLPPM